MNARRASTVLLITQVYPPDPAAVGQYMAEAADELAARGHRVVVLTADRGYDDPSVRYPRREMQGRVEVMRLPLSSFGKRSLTHRLIGGACFVLQAQIRGLFTSGLRGIVVTTVPPFGAAAALMIGAARRVPVTYWIMDLNPDQAVARGVAPATAWRVRAFDILNRSVLAHATNVVVLDRFMADRVRAKADVRHKLSIVPPWPQDDHLVPIPHAENPFRREQGLEGKLVILYSGNISLVHPVDTILEAAQRLRNEPDLVFMFIGGGVGARTVGERITRDGLSNVRLLPYQPLERLSYSLSAGDVHLVAMGDDMVGIVHPSKVYGAMAVARPVLFLGPRQSHVSELLDEHGFGWQICHGDVDGAVCTLREIRRRGPEWCAELGAKAHAVAQRGHSKAVLCRRLADIVEHGSADGSLH